MGQHCPDEQNYIGPTNFSAVGQTIALDLWSANGCVLSGVMQKLRNLYLGGFRPGLTYDQNLTVGSDDVACQLHSDIIWTLYLDHKYTSV